MPWTAPTRGNRPERLEPTLEMGAHRAGIFLQGVRRENVEDGQADARNSRGCRAEEKK